MYPTNIKIANLFS